MPTNQTGIPFATDFQLITEPKPVPQVELQIIGRPSVPVSLFIEHEINSITCKERSGEIRVATLHPEVCRERVSETCSVPAPTLVPCRAPRRQDREHLRTPTRYPSPKNHALSHLTFTPLLSLVSRFSKDLVLNGRTSSQHKGCCREYE